MFSEQIIKAKTALTDKLVIGVVDGPLLCSRPIDWAVLLNFDPSQNADSLSRLKQLGYI